MLHIERQAEHDCLPFAQRATDGAQSVFARGARRMQPFRHGADRAHHVGLLDIEIILNRAVRYVAGEHHERRPAFRRFGDPGQGVGQPRSRMDADQREFAARLGIGVRHARGITLVARRNKLDAGLRQSVRDLEIGGAEERKATTRAIAREIASDHIGDNGIAPAHTRRRSGFRKKLYSPKS